MNATYPEAQAYCNEQNLILPMPKTQAENDELHAATSDLDFFLGLQDVNTDGKYLWYDRAALTWSNFLVIFWKGKLIRCCLFHVLLQAHNSEF